MTGSWEPLNMSWADQDLSPYPGPSEEHPLKSLREGWINLTSDPTHDLKEIKAALGRGYGKSVLLPGAPSGATYYWPDEPSVFSSFHSKDRAIDIPAKPINTGPRPARQYDKLGRRKY